MSSRKPVLAALCLGAALALACGPNEQEVKSNARAEEWKAIQADRDALTALRSQLDSARDQTAAAADAAGESPPAPAADGAEGAPAETAQSAEAQQEGDLQAKVDEATDRFLERLVTFINEHAGFQGEEPPEEVAAAIRMKTEEDMLLAREYIERGGDYAKAIDILQSAKVVDPGNQELQTALDEAESNRYMSEERFSRIEKGMTEQEVHGELGQVKHQNVRKYDDGKVVAWFYPKEGGAAAAVFFRERDGRLKVYDTNFEAVKSAAERAAEGESVEDPATE